MHVPDAKDAYELSLQVVEGPVNKAFDLVLASAIRSITKAIRHRMQSTVFRVPVAVLGCPCYKIEEVVAYVESTLRCKNYEVHSWPSGEMAILWRKAPEPKNGPPVAKSKFDIQL